MSVLGADILRLAEWYPNVSQWEGPLPKRIGRGRGGFSGGAVHANFLALDHPKSG
jgi:hypothetical protein